MANVFWRRPITGGDENSWAQYNDAHILDAIGQCSLKAYDNAGTLNISKGRCGINNGASEGVSIIDTVEVVDFSGIANSHWAVVYMTVSGAVPSFGITQRAETDSTVVPAAFTGAYDTEKDGYYIVAARRIIAMVWIGSTGGLDGIINVQSGQEGYNGYVYVDSGQTKKLMWNVTKGSYRNWGIYEIGDWDMVATASVSITISVDRTKIRHISVLVRGDTAAIDISPLDKASSATGICAGTYNLTGVLNNAFLARVAGGAFDNINYDSTSYNRGWIYFEIEE